MKRIKLFLLAVLWGILFVPFSFAQPARDIAQANNQFAFDLYAQLNSKQGNIFFSPYSLTSALTMTFEGARGQTADEMRMALHLPSDETDWRSDYAAFMQSMNTVHQYYELSTANALWAQKTFPFKADYLKLVKDTYFGDARILDFDTDSEGSRVTINNWVLDKTKNRIKDLLPLGSITKDTRLVLTNAVYFKGKWSVPFNKEATKQDTFWLSPSESVQTAMMGLSGKSFKFTENDQVQVLELPYQGNDLSMLIILPRGKDIQPLEESISESLLAQWDETMPFQSVNVFIPKFKFEVGYQMKNILSSRGIKTAFDKNLADFSGMANFKPNENLYIDQVYHKAWVEVDEEGTQAAAATAIAMPVVMAIMRPLQPKIFRADHPFIFIIQDNKTAHILFLGRVSDPRV